MSDPTLWPPERGSTPIRLLLLRLSETPDRLDFASTTGTAFALLSPADTALAEALDKVQIHTVHDMVRCDWTPSTAAANDVGPGAWQAATNAFLAARAERRIPTAQNVAETSEVDPNLDLGASQDEEQASARALSQFWSKLERVYRLALNVCAGESSLAEHVLPTDALDTRDEHQSQLADTLSFPSDLAQFLPSSVDLGRPSEVVQVAGMRGSGRKTLVMNSVLRSLWLHPEERALWVCVPSLPEEDETCLVAAQDMRQHIATKCFQAQRSLLEQASQRLQEHTNRKRKRTEDDSGDNTHFDWGRMPDGIEDQGVVDRQHLVRYLVGHDPVQRLLVQSATSIEEVQSLWDKVYNSLTQTKKPPSILVLDSLDRLFFDNHGTPYRQFTNTTALPTSAQRLLYALVQLARTHNIRVYILNGAHPASKPQTFEPVFATPFAPAFSGVVEVSVDTTLWLSGTLVFPLDDEEESQAALIHQPITGPKVPESIMQVRQDHGGLRPRVMEVHSSSGPCGRWGVYSSDGMLLYD